MPLCVKNRISNRTGSKIVTHFKIKSIKLEGIFVTFLAEKMLTMN